MFADPKPPAYYAGCNEPLLHAVPPAARRVLDVGCGHGALGAALRQRAGGCTVFGLERDPAAAAVAATRLDGVFALDVQADDPPLEAGSLDAVLYGDVLEHLVDPGAVLARHRRLLAPGGVVLCSVPNVQHHTLLAALLTGDFQYTTAGLLDATHLRFFSAATFTKLLLDAGYAPELLANTAVPCPPDWLAAAGPLLHHLGIHPARAQAELGAYQYLFRGTPLGWDEPAAADEEPLTFVACVSDEARLRANLLASPCLADGSPHEVLLYHGSVSAADGLNRGLAAARHDLVVCLHQDVYLPRGWPARFRQQYRLAEARYGPVGVAGVYGTALRGARLLRAGHVVDRARLLCEDEPLPAAVDALDELLLAVPRGAGLTFEAGLGFHLYGADLCQQARARGLAAVAVDAAVFHHSPHVELPAAFAASARVLAAKWAARLPLATPCAVLDRGGRVAAW